MTTSESAPTEAVPSTTKTPIVSPFLEVPDILTAASKAPSIIHLRRDNHQALTLDPKGVLQTRFGTFPHTSFIDLAPGSQVRASASHPNPRDQRKRKRAAANAASATPTEAEEPISGFLHILAPTAELWTASLPHRTQVVYTPDSSYILHRLGVKPGTQIIEAGAGSGSFTHAAVRAVYSGYPDRRDGLKSVGAAYARKGKVWSFEFHAERAEKLREEIANHSLDTLVDVTHKDVCAEGFMVPGANDALISPLATAVFLDLPAPWLALPHLARTNPTSALDPDAQVNICTFSPCIEQVTRTCNALRSHGWVDISTVEISHQHLEVRRQLPRGYDEGAGPRTIGEALARLKGVNEFREQRKDIQSAISSGENASFAGLGFKKGTGGRPPSKNADEGRLVSRNEPEIKSHTSFLTFATLPRVWTAEQEADAAAWVKEKVSRGVLKGVVGEKERKWKGEEVESKRSRKKRERAAQKDEPSKVEEGESGAGDDMDIDD